MWLRPVQVRCSTLSVISECMPYHENGLCTFCVSVAGSSSITMSLPDDGSHRVQYTANAATILERCSEIAVKTKSVEMIPKHFFLAALLGKSDLGDVDDLHSSTEERTALWEAVCDIEEDPVRLAQATKESILLDVLHDTTSTAPFQGVHLQPTAQNPGQRPRVRDGIVRLLSTRRGGRPAPEPAPLSSSSSTTHVNEKPIASENLVKVIERARQDQGSSGDSYIGPHHLILALLGDESIQDLLSSQDILVSKLVAAFKERKPSEKIVHPVDDEFPFLAKFTVNMTELAREGKLDEIVGRDEEIRRVIQILCRRTKNSAVLIGEPGVGKTAVAEGLAHRIAQNQVPEHLKGTIFSLDMGALFAGAGKGEYEARVKGVIDDVMRSQEGSKPVILFIDELHLITVGKGSGGQSSGMDAANLLKPALARGQFRCIGATTLAEYREHIEKDGALERRFATVMVNEPSIEETNTILRGIRERYEHHHNVWIKDEAIVTASTLAQRYLTMRRLPDSAVDLLDEACASARVSRDMKPEGIDSAEQELLHLQNRILALERDNHPADDAALEAARKDRESLHRKIKNLEEQQAKIVEWWKSIRVRRGVIRALNTDLTAANGARPFNAQRIAELQRQLETARQGLLDMERQGPAVVHPGLDISGCTRTSPDTITAESIAAIVERATKIPVQRLLASDRSRLLDLEQNLRKQVIGQPHAVQAVANAIQLARTGLGNVNRPVASLLFTGPSGTGKTLLSKALAQELFGQTAAMVRIDGSEYAQGHSISRLIGSPPGYVGWDQGGQLTEYVRRTPYCIVLLDEIEKTSPEFLTLFLQVLDEGRLTDGQGRLVDFRNCVIIMTSNVGSDILSKVQQEEIPEATREAVNNRFKERGFPVEFLNRVDEIVMFHPMSSHVMRQILDKHLHDLQQREGIRNIHLDLDDRAKTWLISQGISPEYGARPLARTIQRHLLNPLSQRLLEESVSDSDVVLVRVNENGNGLAVQARRVPSGTAAADPQPVASGSRPRDRIRRIARVGAS